MNRAVFYDYIRPWFGALNETQVEGMEAIFAACITHNVTNVNHIAYALATVHHETGGTFAPVREGFRETDEEARRYVAKYFPKYADEDATSDGKNNLPKTGNVFYGRGYVQLTWADNYLKMQEAISYPLHTDPDLALIPAIAAEILIVGMKDGLFTGVGLDRYFNEEKHDPVSARAIVNGSDKRDLIAEYYYKFLSALKKAESITNHIEEIPMVDENKTEENNDFTEVVKDVAAIELASDKPGSKTSEYIGMILGVILLIASGAITAYFNIEVPIASTVSAASVVITYILGRVGVKISGDVLKKKALEIATKGE